MQQRHEHRLQWWQTSEHAPGTVAPAKSQTVPEGLRRGRRRTAPPKRIRWTLRASGAPAMKRVPLRPGGRGIKYRPRWTVNEIPSTLDRYHPLDQISAAAIDPIAGPRLCSQERWPRSASPLLPLPCRTRGPIGDSAPRHERPPSEPPPPPTSSWTCTQRRAQRRETLRSRQGNLLPNVGSGLRLLVAAAGTGRPSDADPPSSSMHE